MEWYVRVKGSWDGWPDRSTSLRHAATCRVEKYKNGTLSGFFFFKCLVTISGGGVKGLRQVGAESRIVSTDQKTWCGPSAPDCPTHPRFHRRHPNFLACYKVRKYKATFLPPSLSHCSYHGGPVLIMQPTNLWHKTKVEKLNKIIYQYETNGKFYVIKKVLSSLIENTRKKACETSQSKTEEMLMHLYTLTR